MEKEKNCESCEFYVPYYGIRGNKLHYVHKGSCAERYLSVRETQEIPYLRDCPCRRERSTETVLTDGELLIFEIEEKLNELRRFLEGK